ncbi:uncharacterized protein TNIN_290081 [Trichonephila inaurata madagascariensis]|uniref:SMB domain-containing protein n=1 Tax=Trichonephila inaurata madagascariensis TaxID=2747483 RepID=A0A8X7BYH6_9ARAC|nr:uncharacterized protein TNIN_179731 [Trichonephila inaurata madagascariensis]GFY63216.1 uncharacterized protein TNIN_290081 [Trichonephila inaurata madagascariensis]
MLHHFIILFLLVGFPIFGLAVDYSDLQSAGIACAQKDSCTRPTGSVSRAQIAIRNSNFTNRNCECDRLCSAFGDCCIDATALSTIARYRNKRLHCMPFGFDYGYGAYVVDSCPSSYRSSATIRNKCQEEEDDLTDPLASTPVTDSSSSATFKNRYCAECNGASPSHLVSWQLYLNCGTLQANDTLIFQNLRYNTSIRKWGVNHEGEFHKCDVIFDKPSYLEGVRLCRPHVIESCPDSWRRLTVKASCESYMAVVYGNKIYKNVHCAICNGQLVNTLSCEKPWLLISRGNKPFSFALLLDVNRSDGDLVGVVQKCPTGQKYDPFFKKCRTLVCAIPGYKMVNGKCKKD